MPVPVPVPVPVTGTKSKIYGLFFISFDFFYLNSTAWNIRNLQSILTPHFTYKYNIKSYKMVNHNPMSGLRFAVFGFVIALAVAVAVAVQKREK